MATVYRTLVPIAEVGLARRCVPAETTVALYENLLGRTWLHGYLVCKRWGIVVQKVGLCFECRGETT